MKIDLSLKTPPVLLLVIVAILMYFIAPILRILPFGILFGILCALVGMGLIIISVQQFNQTKTTVNPLNPNQTQALVTTGIFAYTRNPMYKGMVWLLLGWAFYLGSIVSFIGVLVFIFWIDRWQIKPEETILREKFGKVFDEYCKKTPRWGKFAILF